MRINHELRRYIQTYIFPLYAKNDEGHRINHIEYVIRRSFLFVKQFESLDENMVFAAAAYHDIAHHINKDLHEELSAKIFWDDVMIARFFTEEQRIIIREAIEDHRASMDHPPRSNYGKILSSADRSTDLDEFIRRTHAYSLRHFPEYTMRQHMERCYQHMQNKYGQGGYAKSYVTDEEYIRFCQEIDRLLKNWDAFECKYSEVISR